LTALPPYLFARGRTGKDKSGFSDPYVTIEYGKDCFATNVINQNLNPVWDEQVTMYMRVSERA